MLLAIDGGNSKTAAVILDESGALLARLAGPGSGGGPAHVAAVVGRMLADWREDSGVDREVRACVAALAGLDFEEDAPRFAAALAAVLPVARITAINDAHAVLAALGEDGVAVIYGAGFNVVARGPLGLATHPALGWSTGEWGGGHELGREAVRIAYRSADGRGPLSTLETAVLEATRQPDHRTLARAIRDGDVSEDAVGRLAELLLRAAATGDRAAVATLDRACQEIVELTLLVSRRAFGPDRIPSGTPVLLAGGVFRDEEAASRVTDGLAALGFAPERFEPDPVIGAVREVCALAGVDGGAAEMELLEQGT